MLCASPMVDMTTAMPAAARINMGLRPNRAASRPQIGAVNAVPRNVMPNGTPDHCTTAELEVTPNCRTYSSRNGSNMLRLTSVVTDPNTQTMRFLCQYKCIACGVRSLLDRWGGSRTCFCEIVHHG